MIKEGRIGTREAVFLTILVLISKAFYTSVEIIVSQVGTAAWYTTLISCATTLVFFMFLYLLMKRFPGKDLIEIFDHVTGKIIGKALTLVFVIYFIYYSGSNLREFLEMIKAYNFPYTQPSLIVFPFLAVVAIMVYVGLEGMARLAAVSFYPIVIGIVVILVLAYPLYEPGSIFPIGGYGIMKSLKVGFLRSSAYSEIIALAFIINSVHGVKSFKKVGIISIIAAGVIFSTVALCSIMIFQYTQAKENLSALFQMARVIFYNRFLQRIETIFLFAWILVSLINIGAAFYISITTFCKAFRVESHRPLIFPFLFLVYLATFYPESISEVKQINIAFVRSYSMVIIYSIPLLTLLLSLMLGKKGEKLKNAKR